MPTARATASVPPTVVAPRRHLDSHVLRLHEDDFLALMLASREVARLLETAFHVERAALMIEGLGVDRCELHISGELLIDAD